MRRSRTRIFGKTFPAWVVAAGLIVATSGAATGVVLAGRVTGTITATVSQALTVASGSLSGVDAGLFTTSDDETAFTASAEINTGDAFRVKMALANYSDAELISELTLIAPDGITLSVRGDDDITDDVVRTGPFTWRFLLPANEPVDNATDITVTVALADDMPPGFYAIDGSFKQVAR